MSDRIMAALFFWSLFFFGDILVAGREQRTTSVLIAPLLSNTHQISSIHLLVDLNLTSHEVREAATLAMDEKGR